MGKSLRAFLLCLLICVLPFYLLPPLGKNVVFFVLSLLVIMPLSCLLGGFFYTLRHRFRWYFPVLVAALMTPTLWLFYNSSAWIYIPGFALANLLGCVAGWGLRKLRQKGTL